MNNNSTPQGNVNFQTKEKPRLLGKQLTFTFITIVLLTFTNHTLRSMVPNDLLAYERFYRIARDLLMDVSLFFAMVIVRSFRVFSLTRKGTPQRLPAGFKLVCRLGVIHGIVLTVFSCCFIITTLNGSNTGGIIMNAGYAAIGLAHILLCALQYRRAAALEAA